MTQMIYAISALGIVAVFAFMMQRSSLDNEQAMYTNEVRAQLMSIARDVADDLNRRDLPFDYATNEEVGPQPKTYPMVHSPIELTDEISFGGCPATCQDLDDFDNMEITGVREGLPYSGKIRVRYVDEDDPDVAPIDNGGKSWAKEVSVTVKTPAIMIGNDSASVTFNMVVAYPRFTDYTVGGMGGGGGSGGPGNGGGSGGVGGGSDNRGN